MSGTVVCCDGHFLESCKENRQITEGTACLATSFSGPYKTSFATNFLAVKTNVIDVSVLHPTC
jgi:hypothetical protein